MNKSPIEYADELFAKANKLKEQFPFQQLATKYFGNLTYTGSSVTNLMADPDIDSNIIISDIKTRKPDIMKFADALTEIKECRKVILYNRLYEQIPYFIINVERFSYEGETWTITFFMQETDFQQVSISENKTYCATELAEQIKKVMTPEQRKTILEFKDFRIKNKLKRTVSSALVYEAVLSKSIDKLVDFKEFLISRGIDPSITDTD